MPELAQTDKRSMLNEATLKAAGAEKTFAEKISGAKTNRRQLAKAIDALALAMCCWSLG